MSTTFNQDFSFENLFDTTSAAEPAPVLQKNVTVDGFYQMEEFLIAAEFCKLDRMLNLHKELEASDKELDEEGMAVLNARFHTLVNEDIVLKAGGKKGLISKVKSGAKKILTRIWEMITKLWGKVTGSSKAKVDKLEKVKAGAKDKKIEPGKSFQANIPAYTDTNGNMFQVKDCAKVIGGLQDNLEAVTKEIERVIKSSGTATESTDLIAEATLTWYGFNAKNKFLGGVHKNNALMLESTGPIVDDQVPTFKPVDTRTAERPLVVELNTFTKDDLELFVDAVRDAYYATGKMLDQHNKTSGMLTKEENIDVVFAGTQLKFYFGLIQYFNRFKEQGWNFCVAAYSAMV